MRAKLRDHNSYKPARDTLDYTIDVCCIEQGCGKHLFDMTTHATDKYKVVVLVGLHSTGVRSCLVFVTVGFVEQI